MSIRKEATFVRMFGQISVSSLLKNVALNAAMILPFSLLACGIYNRTPLIPGANGSGLKEGTYRGTANCTRFFQTRGRTPSLDTFDIEIQRQVNSGGLIVANGTELTADEMYEFDLGIFNIENTVKIVGPGTDGYVVSSEARIEILDDAGNPLTLAGSTNEIYLAAGENVQLTLGVTTQTEDAEQEVVELAFDCTASLLPE